MIATASNRPRIVVRPATVTLRLDWLARAASVPGKAVALGLALLWLAQVRHAPSVRLTRSAIARFSISRDACYDALRRLEAARLITVRRTPGHHPFVTLLGLDGHPLALQ